MFIKNNISKKKYYKKPLEVWKILYYTWSAFSVTNLVYPRAENKREKTCFKMQIYKNEIILFSTVDISW